ncbi:carboxypeptidase A2 [Magnaporthiopsis poae ATCC 64411]|uniref:Carboxypeptidase A2 n=1 Tax=Magnaporthiopsis poae (strain ATCC 64411 / 73-15) TaxID=644358 RepID=A0A0C4DU32_MAGP6|nr:carboxypeptidase A2 [Magnaporthiopsis poae ATCC 64411]
MRFSASKILSLALAVLPLTSASLEKRASKYDGYKVYQIDAVSANYTEIAAAVANIEAAVPLACAESHDHMDVAVSPTAERKLKSLGFKMNLLYADLGARIRSEGEIKPWKSARTAAIAARQAPSLPAMSWFESYRRFEDHLTWLDDVQAAFPKNSQTFVAGKSFEGRDIKGIHLYGAQGPGKRPAVIWHATVHAREWIAAPTVEYMTYKLVDGYLKGDSIAKGAIDKFDFYIMPVVNPDGFVYTHMNNRIWRKNRQSWPGYTCVGTDINRNWPHQWNVAGGASDNPCDGAFRGMRPGDAPENKALVSHTLTVARAQGIKFFADFHSYAQMILVPYGYDCKAKPKTLSRQLKLAGGVASAIKAVNRLKFKYGQTCKTVYQTSGMSMDWGYDVAGAELAWGYEMRPATEKDGGFAIPPSNIVPSGEEQWAGFKYLLAKW